MDTTLAKFSFLLHSPLGLFELASMLVICCCVAALLLAVAINFAEARDGRTVQREQRSVVATGTMLLFFLIYYLLIRRHIGALPAPGLALHLAFVLLGLLLIVLGTVTNIAGRLTLGSRWGDQIRVYRDHQVVSSGVFRLVRHPLYASLIWIGIGGSFVYLNLAAFVATVLIFLPAMYYRARQEEKLLAATLPDYQRYREGTGMFFPRLSLLFHLKGSDTGADHGR